VWFENAMKFSTEVVRKVYDDEDGVYIQVGPDGDGLDLVELRVSDEESKKYYGDVRITLYPAQARLLADALLACADEMEKIRDVKNIA
jgi:hypothetical protein